MTDETADVNASSLVFPALEGIYRRVAPLGYAIIRVSFGLLCVWNGIDKVFFGGAARIAEGNIAALGLPYPYAWAWLVAYVELVAPVLIAIGLFTRPAAFAMTIMLTVIAFGIMIKRGAFWHTGGIEVALLLGLVSLAFVLGGSGRYSLDRLIGREF